MDWFDKRRIYRCDGDYVLKIPDIRQRFEFTCGAACIEAVCRYYSRKCDWAEGLANPVQGMEPGTVEAVLRSLKFRVLPGPMRVADLKHFTKIFTPVLCPVADFEGHWVVVRGVENKRVSYHCPSRGTVFVSTRDWEKNWWSDTVTGIRYLCWGIAVF